MTHTDTFVDEANSFIERNNLEGQQATFGGLWWGMLRAVMECPDCPGVFRIPVEGDDIGVIYCPSCKNVWEFRE